MATRALIMLVGLLFGVGTAWPQAPGSAAGQGAGSSGGHGMGGPGMMGGMGPGMMGGMGPGMMGGPGMMNGYGANWLMAIPSLTDEQRGRIAAMEKEFRQKQWQLMEKMHDLAFQSGVYRGGKFDEQAARNNYDAMAALRKQMFENGLDEQKRIDAILTPQQREQLQQSWSRQ